MLKPIVVSTCIITFLILSCKSPVPTKSVSKPIDHTLFTEVLQKHVDTSGMVDYKALQSDSNNLHSYLQILKSHHPNDENWTREEQLTYWINAYNAFTLILIVRHYPIKSIKDIVSGISVPLINSPWDLEFIKIEGNRYDLNDIEHGIIREKFNEPRIHFALVCAAKGCPKLRNESYIAEQLNEQLKDQTLDFINDTTKNNVNGEAAKLSKIFWWYGSDFKTDTTLEGFINQQTDKNLSPNTEIKHMDYDWELNEQSL